MARILTSTQKVIDTTLEHVKALDAQRELWSSAEGRNLPRRAAGSVADNAKAAETEAVLRMLVDKLISHLDDARYVLKEIGGEMAGIQADAHRARGDATFVV